MPPKPYYSSALGLDYRHGILQIYKGFTRLSLEPLLLCFYSGFNAFIQGSSNSLAALYL